MAVTFVLLHLPFLPPSLEDLDSINFALGLHDFDVADHQPHPPGYPVFMLLARAALAVSGSEVVALSAVSLAAGALGIVALAALFDVLGGGRAAVIASAAVAACAPLYWLTAVRPLSDMTGLAAVLATQAVLLRARTPRGLAGAAAFAGVAAGVRSQVVWLTLPLLALVVFRFESAGRARLASTAGTAYVAGALAWGIPLVIATGGPVDYWRALTAQGAEDFANVSMLLTSFTPRLAVNALRDTFVAPWAVPWLAVPVLASAALGAAVTFVRDRPALLVMAAAFGPYLAFHLLLQETFTTRYALPLVVPVAWLAVRVLAGLGRAGIFAVSTLAAASLAVGQPAAMAYGRAAAPAFRLLSDMSAAHESAPEAPVLAMHRRGAFDFRRPLRWVETTMAPFAGRLDSPPKHEWLELVRYWNSGGRRRVWFIADPFRSDLALVHHDGPAASYRWPFPAALVGGARPDTMDWYVFDRPAWYLGEGWALTPETGGVAAENGKGPGLAPIDGWIRRTHGPMLLMIGGRNLADGGPPVNVRVALDGAPVAEWVKEPGFFLEWVELKHLSGPGEYARLSISGSSPALAIEQFDAQPLGTVVHGYAAGWHELEFNPVEGQLWRWTSDRALVDVRAGSQALLLDLAGETDRSAGRARLTVRLADRVLLDQHVDGRFVLSAPIPPGALAGGAGTLVIETDRIHIPAEHSRRSTDRRRLGLKIYETSVRPVS